MKSVSKEYIENERRYRFNAQAFQSLMNQKKHAHKSAGTRMTKEMIMGEIADKMMVSYEAVKNWAYGYNGPAELEQIIMLGDYFGVNYHTFLLSEEKEMAETKTVMYVDNSQAQISKKQVRKIYRAMLKFTNKCRDWYYDELKTGSYEEKLSDEYKKKAKTAREDVEKTFYKINELLENAMLDLPEGFYLQVRNYLWDSLLNVMETLVGEELDEITEADLKESGNFYDYQNWTEEALEQFLDTRYMEEMRTLFAPYIVRG